MMSEGRSLPGGIRGQSLLDAVEALPTGPFEGLCGGPHHGLVDFTSGG